MVLISLEQYDTEANRLVDECISKMSVAALEFVRNMEAHEAAGAHLPKHLTTASDQTAMAKLVDSLNKLGE